MVALAWRRVCILLLLGLATHYRSFWLHKLVLSILIKFWNLIGLYGLQKCVTGIAKTYIARTLQWINNPKGWCNNHEGWAEVIITSFIGVIYPLKYPSLAVRQWPLVVEMYLVCRNVRGVLPVSRCLTKIKYLNTSQISKHC